MQLAPEATMKARFSFFRGREDLFASQADSQFDWMKAALRTREQLSSALSAKNISVLLGSGCSSLVRGGVELGVPTMFPLAKDFLGRMDTDDEQFASSEERDTLNKAFGVDITGPEYSSNLERLMETLYSAQFLIERSGGTRFQEAAESVRSVIDKVVRYVYAQCTAVPLVGGSPVLELYRSFYRKLCYRDRALPKPWVFTTNYDLLNEAAMDSLGIPYTNGFSGVVERRFNPSVFRYALAEQIDVSSQRWASVENFVYLCKLHGSVSWSEEGKSLFPIRETLPPPLEPQARVMIYPTPAKQAASLGSPYSDLFREFQGRIARDQSVLITIGYSFGDDHVNNIIFQALTIPTFRLVVFLDPKTSGVPAQLKALNDPRIWIIGGQGPSGIGQAHYFETIVEHFLPELPSDKVDTAISNVLEQLILQSSASAHGSGNGHG